MKVRTRARRIRPLPTIDRARLSKLWIAYCAGATPRCPICASRRSRIGVTAAYEPRAYQLWCACCGWRSAWFASVCGADISILTLDPIAYAASG